LSEPSRSLRLAFAGTPAFAVPALEALAARHAVAAVFTQQDRPAGRGRSLQMSAVKQRAVELGIPVHQPASFKSAEALELLRGLEVDAFIVVAYGLILPPAALAIPRFGCLNIHASLLPRWRGAAPIQRAILAGDRRSGVTIMRMEAGLDTGPMLAASCVDIDAHETSKSLHDRLAPLGATLVCEVLEDLSRGAAREVPQPTEGVTYAAKIDKAEALIDWQDDAAAIARKVHAFDPWPIAETRLHGAQLRIWEAQAVLQGATDPLAPVAAASPGGASSPGSASSPGNAAVPGCVLAATAAGIDVACGRGLLRIQRLQLPGRKPLTAQQFATAQPLVGVCMTRS
jgi:methionyl-tRNA formyltransferase